MLWIASERGLFQFDGVRFDRFEPSSGQALPPRGTHVLLALPDTSLWIGHFTSGVSVIHRGKVVTYDTQDGLPGGTVTAIARDSGGTMWASTTRGLARLNGRKWEEMGPGVGYPGGFTEPVLVDQRGSVWAVGETGIYVFRRGAQRFQKREATEPGGRGSRSVAGDCAGRLDLGCAAAHRPFPSLPTHAVIRHLMARSRTPTRYRLE